MTTKYLSIHQTSVCGEDKENKRAWGSVRYTGKTRRLVSILVYALAFVTFPALALYSSDINIPNVCFVLMAYR